MLGRAGLWLCALAVGTLPARGYEEVTGTARRSTLVDYLRSSSAGLDEAQCLARVADLQSSPYAFLKGTPELFFADLDAQDELTYNEFASEAASTWLVGDATFEKLGVFENDRGQRIFDFIDADDAWVASYLLDVYRLAASLSVLAKDEGASPYEAVVTFVDFYIEKLRKFVIMPGLRNINDAQGIAGGYPKATLEGALADRAELLRTWEEGTVAASTGEHTAVDAAVQSYATRSSLGDAAYFAVKSVVKMSGASYTAPSFRVRVEGASAQNATDDQVLWVKAQLPYPPLVDYVSASQQRRFDGTALADPAARVAAAHDAMLINTVDGLGATMMNGIRTPLHPHVLLSSVSVITQPTPVRASTSRVFRLARPLRSRPARSAMRLQAAEAEQTEAAEPDLEEAYSDAVSSWNELSVMASLGYAIIAGSETYDIAGLCRLAAAESIGPKSTFDCLAPTGAVQYYAKALDGTLFNSSTVIDTHYRILKDCLVQDNYDLVDDTYKRLANAEPKIPPELLLATASVGVEALEYLKEEHDLVVAMLADEVGISDNGPLSNIDESMRRDYLTSKAIVDGVDKVIVNINVVSGH